MPQLHTLQIEPIIKRALEEDWGSGDWTTDLCVPADLIATATIIAKADTLICGLEIAKTVFQYVDPQCKITTLQDNGDQVLAGTKLLHVTGNARCILKAERVALNFLAHMSGIATETHKYVQLLEPFPCNLLDTRKTTPGLRLFEKFATSIGGARNHRLCLTDGVLVKENHIRAAGGISSAVSRLLEGLPPTIKVEVETTNLEEVHEALEAGVQLIMLDNMSIAEMSLAVRTVQKKALLEASGNVTLANIVSIAETGVDFISTSSILYGASWADLSLLFSLPETESKT